MNTINIKIKQGVDACRIGALLDVLAGIDIIEKIESEFSLAEKTSEKKGKEKK